MNSKFSLVFLFFMLSGKIPHYSRYFNLRKLISIISLVLFIYSCDDIPSDVIEQGIVENNVLSINAPTSFFYSQADSLLDVSIQFQDVNTITNVWIKISSINGDIIITENYELFDNGNIQQNGDNQTGDKIFSNKVPVSKKYSNGKYIIDFFIEDNIRVSPDNISKVGVHIFEYNNNQINYPPVISNLSIPLIANRGVAFVFSVKADDQNGLIDLAQVYFKLYRPDGTLVDPQNGFDYFLMVDNGDPILGDQTANDGVYSFKNLFGTTAQTGTWKFEFQAKDRSNMLSNLIIHNMSVN